MKRDNLNRALRRICWLKRDEVTKTGEPKITEIISLMVYYVLYYYYSILLQSTLLWTRYSCTNSIQLIGTGLCESTRTNQSRSDHVGGE